MTGSRLRTTRLFPILLLLLAGMLGGCQVAGMSLLHGANMLARTGAYQRQAELPYGQHEHQRLDVYTPTAGERPYPVVVFFYGGEWSDQYPDKALYRFVGDALTSRGMVAVVCDYRRYPSARFPAFVEDAAAVVAWTRAHIEWYGGDPEAIFVMGHSAGAHLGALVTLDERYLREAGGRREWVRGFIGMGGPYRFPDQRDVPLLVELFGSEEQYLLSQPIHHANGSAPPMLLIGGGRDERVPLEVMEALAARVEAAGGEVEQIVYENLDHIMLVGSLALPVRWGRPVLDHVARWVYEQHGR